MNKWHFCSFTWANGGSDRPPRRPHLCPPLSAGSCTVESSAARVGLEDVEGKALQAAARVGIGLWVADNQAPEA